MDIKKFFSYRAVYSYIFLLSIILLISTAYLEYVKLINPCILCLLQRIIWTILLLTTLTTILHNHNVTSRKIYNSLNIFVVFLGILVAGRQVWLELLPANTQDLCIPPSLANDLPWSTAIKTIIQGTPECQQVIYKILNLTPAEWSLFAFIICFLVILLQFYRTKL